MRKIERLYNLLHRSIFTINGTLSYNRINDCFVKLCNVINETEHDETIWYIGEFNEACLSDLLIGAYWHYTEWHCGQTSSEYLSLCTIGSIYSPGMECEPQAETGEKSTYDLLNELAESEAI